MKQRQLPRYVSEFRDRHGKMRVRFRRKGHEPHYFRALPWTPDFMAEYQSCLIGASAPAVIPRFRRTVPGSFDELIAIYYSAPVFAGLRPSTRATYRGILERFRAHHGSKRVCTIERQHILSILGGMSETPAASNNLLDRLRGLMRLALDLGWRKDDPTHRVSAYRLDSDGFHSWTEEEIGIFEACHPVGSRSRLAETLLLYTGQRRSDVVRMGWQHISDHRISVAQLKTRERLQIPVHPALYSLLEREPRGNPTFLLTQYERPFSAAGFGNWFRDRCDEAGLHHCSAHGLRKAAARRLAEAACINKQIMAITGHKTDKEVGRYTAAADQNRLADQAMAQAYGMERDLKTV